MQRVTRQLDFQIARMLFFSVPEIAVQMFLFQKQQLLINVAR